LRKVIFILFLIVLNTGCFVFRTRNSDKSGISEGPVDGSGVKNLVKYNLSQNSYFIQKAEVEIDTPEGTEKVLASVRYEFPHRYLISVKSRTGIEAARIYISDDTILVNDRINRKLYCGSERYLKKRYGMSIDLIPVIFGDYINQRTETIDPGECKGGMLKVEGVVAGTRVDYVIDCKRGKSVLTVPQGSYNSEEIRMQYGSFIRTNDFIVPGTIEIKYSGNNRSIIIRIKKIETPWAGKIEFIPGNNYEIVPLL
jgi:hypothetical protein